MTILQIIAYSWLAMGCFAFIHRMCQYRHLLLADMVALPICIIFGPVFVFLFLKKLYDENHNKGIRW